MVLSIFRARWAGELLFVCSSQLWYIMSRLRLVPFILALTLSNTACFFHKRPAPRVFVPPPPAPRPAVATSQPELPSPREIRGHVEPPDLEIPANMPSEAAPPPSPAPRRTPPPV